MKNINISRNDIYVLLTIFIVILVIPFAVSAFWEEPSFSNTGIVGDTFAGLTAPFLSFLGSALVYLALKAQIDANDKISLQFEEQNKDQLFFRLYDNLKEKVRQINIVENGENKEGLLALDVILKNKSFNTTNGMLSLLGYKIFDKQFDLIDKEFKLKLLAEIGDIERFNFDDDGYLKEELEIKKLENQENEERLDYLLTRYETNNPERANYKTINYNSRNIETNSPLGEIFARIGINLFYKTPFEERIVFYETSFNQLTHKYTPFIDAYLMVLKYLLINISENNSKGSIRNKENKKNEQYADFLFYNLSELEKDLLIFTLIGNSQDEDFKRNIAWLFKDRNLRLKSEYSLYKPTKEELASEIIMILKKK